jgi:hypothetical protein
LLLVALVAIAVLIILLRLAEYSSHGVRHRRATITPGFILGSLAEPLGPAAP